jgi:hypothetical protein
MATTTRKARGLLWRSLHHCATARWHSLANLGLPMGEGKGSAAERALELVLLLRDHGLRRMHPAALVPERPRQTQNLSDSVILWVELAFQHLRLAEQRLLLGDRPAAGSHCRQFLNGLLSATVAVLGEAFSRDEEEFLLASARQLTVSLAAQLELRQALVSGGLPDRLIFVLGMHRSGTSALSGMLCKAGFDAPSDLMPPNDVNPRGYWESSGLFALNETLLQELGSRWDQTAPLPEGWQHGEAAIRWRSRVLQHLCQVYAGSTAPLIKDPRFCLLLTGMDAWLESGSLQVEMLLTLRDPLEAARSLEQAQNLPSPEGLRLWLQHVLAAERSSRGWPRLLLDFHDLIHQPKASLNRCLALLEREQNETALAQEASSFVHQDLHRQRREELEEELLCSTRSNVSVRELALGVYALLRKGELDSQATATALDTLTGHWRLLSESTPKRLATTASS